MLKMLAALCVCMIVGYHCVNAQVESARHNQLVAEVQQGAVSVNGTSNCTEVVDAAACNGNCKWDSNKNMCYDGDVVVNGCSSYTNFDACLKGGSCSWDGNQCMDKVTISFWDATECTFFGASPADTLRFAQQTFSKCSAPALQGDVAKAYAYDPTFQKDQESCIVSYNSCLGKVVANPNAKCGDVGACLHDVSSCMASTFFARSKDAMFTTRAIVDCINQALEPSMWAAQCQSNVCGGQLPVLSPLDSKIAEAILGKFSGKCAPSALCSADLTPCAGRNAASCGSGCAWDGQRCLFVPYGSQVVPSPPGGGNGGNGGKPFPLCTSICGTPEQCMQKLQALDTGCEIAKNSVCVEQSNGTIMKAVDACEEQRCKCSGGSLSQNGDCVNQTSGGDRCSRYENQCQAQHKDCMVKALRAAVDSFDAQKNSNCSAIVKACADSESWKPSVCVLEHCAYATGCDPNWSCQAPIAMPDVCVQSELKCTKGSADCRAKLQSQERADSSCDGVMKTDSPCRNAIATSIPDLQAEACEKERCACFGGSFDETKWAGRPKTVLEVRSEVYCNKLGGVDSCALAGKCMRDFQICQAKKWAEVAKNLTACKDDANMKTCIVSLESMATSAFASKDCVNQECSSASRIKDEPMNNYNYNNNNGKVMFIQSCADIKEPDSCNNVNEAPGCHFDDASSVCVGQLTATGSNFPSFESIANYKCSNSTIEEVCQGVSPFYNADQCKSCGPDAASCAQQGRSRNQVCSSEAVQKAFTAAVQSDASAQVDYGYCIGNFTACLQTIVKDVSAAKCSDVRKCFSGVTGCQLSVFQSRATKNALFGAAALTECINLRSSDATKGWPVDFQSAFCSGTFPRFAEVDSQLTSAIVAFSRKCTVSSLCNPTAAAPALVTVQIKIEMKAKVQGVPFEYYLNATVSQQQAFQQRFITDLYKSLGLKPEDAAITITNVYAGSIAVDYVVVQTVIQEQGAPPPPVPVLPGAGDALQITNTLASLATDLKVPASVLETVSAQTTSDPVVTTVTIVGTPAPTPSTTTAISITSSAAQNMSIMSLVVALVLMVLSF